MTHFIGKCSLCGGNVTIPSSWMSIDPPVPSCDSCGAVKKDTRPVIEMVKPSQKEFLTENNVYFKRGWTLPH